MSQVKANGEDTASHRSGYFYFLREEEQKRAVWEIKRDSGEECLHLLKQRVKVHDLELPFSRVGYKVYRSFVGEVMKLDDAEVVVLVCRRVKLEMRQMMVLVILGLREDWGDG